MGLDLIEGSEKPETLEKNDSATAPPLPPFQSKLAAETAEIATRQQDPTLISMGDGGRGHPTKVSQRRLVVHFRCENVP